MGARQSKNEQKLAAAEMERKEQERQKEMEKALNAQIMLKEEMKGLSSKSQYDKQMSSVLNLDSDSDEIPDSQWAEARKPRCITVVDQEIEEAIQKADGII